MRVTTVQSRSHLPSYSGSVTTLLRRKCGHVYDRATAEKFLEQYSKKRKDLKCPVVGCGNQAITRADLVSDPELTRKVARQARGV